MNLAKWTHKKRLRVKSVDAPIWGSRGLAVTAVVGKRIVYRMLLVPGSKAIQDLSLPDRMAAALAFCSVANGPTDSVGDSETPTIAGGLVEKDRRQTAKQAKAGGMTSAEMYSTWV